jgi:hypothetical protein
MRTVLSGGEAMMSRSTYADNAIAAPLPARLRAPEQAEKPSVRMASRADDYELKA